MEQSKTGDYMPKEIEIIDFNFENYKLRPIAVKL